MQSKIYLGFKSYSKLILLNVPGPAPINIPSFFSKNKCYTEPPKLRSFKDGRPYLFHSFRNKYFNKISLGNMLYFQNKL